MPGVPGCREAGFEPVWPLAAVALVDKIGTLQEVAGSGHNRGFGLKDVVKLLLSASIYLYNSL